MQICIDVTCMYIDFGGRVFLVSEILLPSKMAKFSLSDHGLYSPWSPKNIIDQSRLKKFMLVGIDITCMHTNFGGRDISTFGDTATLKNGQISLYDHGL